MLGASFVCRLLYWTPTLVFNSPWKKKQRQKAEKKKQVLYSREIKQINEVNLPSKLNHKLITSNILSHNFVMADKYTRDRHQFSEKNRSSELMTPPPPPSTAAMRSNVMCNTPAPHDICPEVRRNVSGHTVPRSSSDPNVPTINHLHRCCSTENSDWMSQLPERARNTSIYSLTIPGSHDSGSYSLEIAHGLSPDRPNFREKWWYKMFPKIALRITKEWSKTQDIDIFSQLQNGVRYLDIRVAPLSLGYTGGGSILRKKRSTSLSRQASERLQSHQSTPSSEISNLHNRSSSPLQSKLNDLRFVHALYGPRILDILDQVKYFLDSHPKEIVILHFQHLVSLSPDVESSLVAHIEKLFANQLVPSAHKDSKHLSISQLNSLGYQVILFFPDDKYVSDFIWPASYLPNPWANTTKASVLFKFLDNHISSRKADRFYVTQGVLTPDDAFVTKNLLSSLKKSLAVKANRLIEHWLKSKTIGPKGPNIVMIDFVELDDFQVVRTVISMNTRGHSRGEL